LTNEITKDERVEISSTDPIYQDLRTKLIKAGFISCRQLALSTITDISQRLKVNMDQAETIAKWATENLESSGVKPASFSSANEIYVVKERELKLSSGCKDFDVLLNGGIELGALTELYGSAGSGKTQMCYSLAVMIQQPVSKGGLEGKVVYIDTENKFSSDRILQIAMSKGFDPEPILKNIYVVGAVNVIHQERAISDISLLAEKDNKIKLVIVDSIINHYRQEFIGRQNLAERQSRLEKCVRLLRSIAELYNIAVVLTNQVSSSADYYSRNILVSAGGNVIAHASKHKIYLRCNGQNFVAKVVNSASLPREEVLFAINDSGVTDPRKKTNIID